MPSLFDIGRFTSIDEAKVDFMSTFIVTKLAESPVPTPIRSDFSHIRYGIRLYVKMH